MSVKKRATERARHPKTTIVGHAPTEADNDLRSPIADRLLNDLADTESAGAVNIEAFSGDCFDSGDLTHFKHSCVCPGDPGVTRFACRARGPMRGNPSPFAA